MEFATLLLLHSFFGILWAGGAIAVGFFVIPSVMEAGPGGGAVMAGVMKRRFPVFMTASAVLVVLSGLRLYSIRFSAAFLGTPEGIALTLGGLLGVGAFFIGVFVQRPMAGKLGTLAATVAAQGRPPTPEQSAELDQIRARLGRIGRLTAWHLVLSAFLMASHRLAAML